MADEQNSVPWSWWWGYSATPGSYNGDFSSKADAIAAVRSRIPPNSGEHTVQIVEGRPAPLKYNLFLTDAVLEEFQAVNSAVGDDRGSLRDMETTEGMRLELQEALENTFRTWCLKYQVGRAFELEIKTQETFKLKGSGE